MTGLVAVLPYLALGCGNDKAGALPGPGAHRPPLSAADNATIHVDSGVRFQTISGWEATAQAGQQHPAFPLFKDELFDRAVDELGINRLRVEVRAGAENPTDFYSLWRSGQIDDGAWRCSRYATVNDNSDPNEISWSGFNFSELDAVVESVVLPLEERLKERGETLFVNVSYIAFTKQLCEGQYDHDDAEEYAEFVLATHEHLKQKYGLVPDSWEVILEPDNVAQWGGREIGEAIAASVTRLRANGFATRFVAPSNANMGKAIEYFDDMLSVSGIASELLEFSYHRYRGVSDANLRAISERAAELEVGTAMLEHIGSGHEDLHEDLKLGRVSAWQQFALSFPGKRPLRDRGAVYYLADVTDPTNPRLVPGSRTKFLRQYFRYLRRGATRIAATTADQAFDPLAFVHPDGRFVIVVEANEGGRFTISGLPAGSYGVNYATSDAYDVDGPDQIIGNGGLLSAAIPDRGVLTVYQK